MPRWQVLQRSTRPRSGSQIWRSPRHAGRLRELVRVLDRRLELAEPRLRGAPLGALLVKEHPREDREEGDAERRERDVQAGRGGLRVTHAAAPWPHPRPVRPAEERADDGQHDDDDHERGEDRVGDAPLGREPAPGAAGPRSTYGSTSSAITRSVGHDHAADERRVVHQFLQPEEVPGRLGRVRRARRIGHLLERRHEDERDDVQHDDDAERDQQLAVQQVRPGEHLVVRIARLDGRRRPPGQRHQPVRLGRGRERRRPISSTGAACASAPLRPSFRTRQMCSETSSSMASGSITQCST